MSGPVVELVNRSSSVHLRLNEHTEFKVDKDTLCRMIEHRDDEGRRLYEEYRGTSGVGNMIGVDIKVGIPDNEAKTTPPFAERKQHFGTNRRAEREGKSFLSLVWNALHDLTLRVLLLAGTVSIPTGIYAEGWDKGWIDGVAIYFAVTVVVLVSSVNDYMKDKQFRALNAVREDRPITVLRGGHVSEISIHDLLVGDVMIVGLGEQLPADGLLIESNGLSMDESAMTGESHLVNKRLPAGADRGDPFMISGTQVMEGTGKMLVIAVGDATVQGKAMALLQGETAATPLQEKLETIASDIGKLGVICAGLTVLALFIRLAIRASTAHQGWQAEYATDIIRYFIIGITVIVVAVPEGLPLAVTISLAYSVKKMLHENNLVRHLDACETMGGANNICSDKTGTLTQNRMTVVKMWANGQLFPTLPRKEELAGDIVQLLCDGAAVNSTADIKWNSASNKFDHIGNKTECALLTMTHHLGASYTAIRKQFRDQTSDQYEHVFPFSSARKRMSTIVKLPSGGFRIFVKGASEIVLDQCAQVLTATGLRPLSPQDKTSLKSTVINPFASEALRTICLAYRDLPERRDWAHDMENDTPNAEKDLVLIGIVGIEDPVRDEVPGAVRKCQTAGIRVRMVTGDNVDTARSIATKCHIYEPDKEPMLTPEYAVMEGPKFRTLVGGIVYDDDDKEKQRPRVGNLETFRKIAENLRVLARSSPTDKFILVTGLLQLGNVVAVTGDGTNDAPALKKADVGFAMGIAGTEVAKEAADIILLDDNFSSTVTAVKYGRNVYDCIRKFLQFQLTVNVVAVLLTFIGAVGIPSGETPLYTIQMLWVNMIMDSLASLALATEPPSDDLLKRAPYTRTEYLVTPAMWRNIIGMSVYQIIILSLLTFRGDVWFGVPNSGDQGVDWTPEGGVHYTIVFNTFVFMQVFNEINTRKLKPDEYNVFKGFFNNFLFLGIIAFIVLVQILLVQFGGQALHCSPLTAAQHGICIGIGAACLVWGLLVKFIPLSLFERFKMKEEEPIPEKRSDIVGKLRRSSAMLKDRYGVPATSSGNLARSHTYGVRALYSSPRV